jgi:flagellar motility protein MotE (MotC chaperone)
MNLIREFRIIPTVLIAISCLVVLKVAGLLLDGGYILNDKSPPPKMSWAQENLGFPTGRPAVDMSDVTGSVSAKKEEPATKPAAEPDPPQSEGQVIYPDPTRPVTASERAVLERLQSRRQEIEARAREIDIRESLIKSAEKRIEGKTEELKAIESRITAATEQKKEAETARFKGIITMYEGMKPKDAARVFDRLELPVLFEIASQIAPRKMADILGQMKPEAAERLTVELARRASGDKMMSSASDLPKIEGRPQPVGIH